MDDRQGLPWILAAYAVVSLLSILAARSTPRPRERGVWLATAVALLLMAAGKAANLLPHLSTAARSLAKSQGWYADRLPVQLAIAVLVPLATVAVIAAVVRSLAGLSGQVKAAASILLLLIGFVMLRGASVHALDPLLSAPLAGMRMSWWVELGALAALAWAAASARRRS